MPKISCSSEAYVFDTIYYSSKRIRQLEPMEGRIKVYCQDKTLGEDDDKDNGLEVIDGVGAETGQCREFTVGGRYS
ncbi:hypothetical protein MKW92_044323 [Papaver armeniacum]|nr:hypothetical protein MKW92_044323 [Papaver armeniacum]